jgi:hypothetical protein
MKFQPCFKSTILKNEDEQYIHTSEVLIDFIFTGKGYRKSNTF